MEYKDYYKILGVPKTASQKEIKQAYRKLARKYHPDVNPGDRGAELKFKELNEAYEVLSDEDKRSKYDQLGANWKQYEQYAQRGGFGGATPGGGGFRVEFGGAGPEGLGGFSDFFKTFFGGGIDLDDLLGGARRGGVRGAGFGGASRPGPSRGIDVSASLEISLEEAYSGTRKRLSLQVAPGQPPQQLDVKIPVGVRSGSRVRVTGKGEPGMAGGPEGDLYLEIKLRPHPVFQVVGDDLHADVPVTLAEAALGAEIEVPTLTGKARIKVPEGSQSGRQLRLRGKGLPRLKGGGHGDLLVRLRVVTPTDLSERERTLIQELNSLRKENPRAPLGCA